VPHSHWTVLSMPSDKREGTPREGSTAANSVRPRGGREKKEAMERKNASAQESGEEYKRKELGGDLDKEGSKKRKGGSEHPTKGPLQLTPGEEKSLIRREDGLSTRKRVRGLSLDVGRHLGGSFTVAENKESTSPYPKPNLAAGKGGPLRKIRRVRGAPILGGLI